jgi:hypothetical protein
VKASWHKAKAVTLNDIKCATLALKFVQLLCDGHFQSLQIYMTCQNQGATKTNYNIIVAVVTLLKEVIDEQTVNNGQGEKRKSNVIGGKSFANFTAQDSTGLGTGADHEFFNQSKIKRVSKGSARTNLKSILQVQKRRMELVEYALDT